VRPNRWRVVGVEELSGGQKWRKEGGFWPPGLTAYIGGEENGPAWGHGLSVQPLAVSRLGRDGAACRAADRWGPRSV
jgi:hypothetical protein